MMLPLCQQLRDYDLFLHLFTTCSEQFESFRNSVVNSMCGELGSMLPPLNTRIIQHLFMHGYYGDAVLRKAAHAGNLELVQWINECGYAETQCMHYVLVHACEGGNVELVDYLLSQKHLNRLNSSANPYGLVDMAASHGHLAIVQLLINKYGEKFSSNAYEFAAGDGHVDVVAYLHGLDLPIQFSPELFNRAAFGGHLPLVQFLYNNVKAENRQSLFSAPLRLALNRGHLDVFTFLHTNMPQLLASVAESDIIGLLKSKKQEEFKIIAPLFEPTRFNWEVLFFASLAGCIDAAKYIIDKKYVNNTTCQFRVRTIKDGHFDELFQLCINNGFGIEVEGNEIDIAIELGCGVPTLKYMHSMAYQATTRAFDQACAAGNIELVLYLHEKGYTCTDQAILSSVHLGHVDVAEFLLANRTEHESLDNNVYFERLLQGQPILPETIMFLRRHHSDLLANYVDQLIPFMTKDLANLVVDLGLVTCTPKHLGCLIRANLYSPLRQLVDVKSPNGIANFSKDTQMELAKLAFSHTDTMLLILDKSKETLHSFNLWLNGASQRGLPLMFYMPMPVAQPTNSTI
ncbi:hypothetical protein SAMD00019534_052680 [Acytostelium subglobosum LB1]|uniref:hypothetical protein n=1 Tax=Acytostelium subglobosum LB1 TaxID=1410327 RepID=UPI000644FF93|nr:hypothetical protein SAMD00019534_052680 [Acytostelium subglobosum LB1]GAM22093.1 hypothetical protein SAMD00019534_052680 [Acytostelium subglobosum LB1]|eukprot:XP_012755193.1 hypothetical protein SAMD00019534_052680 [Acytostelium subglobosum LB1]